MSDVTLVVTSCGRPDLLERTLESFFSLNKYPLARTIIIEDGPSNPPAFPVPDLTYIANGARIGQVSSIDRAYSCVDTPYVLHWEDDWETYRGGFIEPSLEILERYPEILQVWLRPHDETASHPIVKLPQFNVPTMSADWKWGGFSWGPGLRRMSDYRRLGGYSQFKSRKSSWAEHTISKVYHSLGYHAAILPEPAGYVRHIGDDRSLGGWWNGVRPCYEPRNLAFANGLDRWSSGGSFAEQTSQAHWRDYASAAGDGIAVLYATVPDPVGLAHLGQEIFADDYLGAIAAFRCKVRVEGTAGRAGLFLRLSGRIGRGPAQGISGPPAQDAALADPNNKTVTITDGQEWTSRDITARIPADTDTLVFGVFLVGPGRIELRDAELTRS